MKHFSLKNTKWLIAPLITVAIIGVMGFYYSVIYLPNRVEYLSGRNLRILATIGSEITSATEDYSKVLRLQGQTDGSTLDEEAHKKTTETYTIEHAFDRVETETKWTITYAPVNPTNKPKKNYSRSVKFTPREFDIVLVVNQQGQVLFHHAPAGIQIRSLDQLVGSANVSSKQDENKAEKSQETESNKKDGDKAKKSQETESKQSTISEITKVQEVIVAGQAYRMFLLPMEVPIKLESDDPSSMKDKERWVIAGLVKKSRFLSESESISYTLRSVVLSLMIVMLVSIPLMRMLTVCQREHVRPLNIVMLGSSLLMGTALVVLFMADIFVHTSAESRLNHQANDLAEEIAKHVTEETQLAYKQLDSMTPKAMNEWQWQQGSQQLGLMTPQAVQQVEQKVDILNSKVDGIIDLYPFLNEAFWVDPKGDLRVNWTILPKDPNPRINLSDRAYFKRARDNRLLTMSFGTNEGPQVARLWVNPVHSWSTTENTGVLAMPQVARLWVEPIYSWTTAENTVVLSMPLSDTVPEFEQWVAALETKFLSLINPVMPKGFGFAVIDERGLVLFHSQQQRNLRGSFLEETDQDRTIQAALAGRMSMEGDGTYWGQDQHFVAKPLEGVPWTLVVFRDKQLLRTAAAEGLATATILLLLYALLLSVLFTAGWVLCKSGKPSHGYRATWLWPQGDKQLVYRRIMVFNLGMVLVLTSFILWGHGWKTLAVGAGIPLIALGFAVVQWMRWGNSIPPVVHASRGLYQLAAASFVLVLSFFPAIAFFKVAYDVENDLFLKQGQLSLAKSLTKREQRVRDAYEKIAFSSSERKEEFFQRRLNTDSGKEMFDVYSRFFADTTIRYEERVPSLEPESSWIEQQFLQLVETIRIPFNDRATKSIGMLYNVSSDGTRSWVKTSDAELVLYYTPPEGFPSAKPVIRLSSQMTVPLETHVVVFAAITIALGGWGVYFLIGRIGQTIFGSRLTPVSEYKATQGGLGDPIGNALVLGPNVPSQMSLGSYHLIDFNTVMADDTWIDTVRADIAKARGASIALLNWDRQTESPSRNQQKLQLLRELLTEERAVLIQSRIDPTHFDLEGDIDTNSEQTWAHALRSFSRWYPEEDRGDVAEFEKGLVYREELAFQRVDGGSQEHKRNEQAEIKAASDIIRKECRSTRGLQAIGSEVAGHLDLARVTTEEVLETMRRMTDPYYRQLWATCSWAEQYVLSALAKDGFVCCTQPEVQHLLQRGLIAQKSILSLPNETFREWILEECRDPIYARAWKKSKPEQTWIEARHILVGILVASGLFLSVTQQEQAGDFMEFGTALLAGIPIVGEWLAQLTGEKTPSTAKTA